MCDSFIQMETMPHLSEKNLSQAWNRKHVSPWQTNRNDRRNWPKIFSLQVWHLIYVREEEREKGGRGCEGEEGGETAEKEDTEKEGTGTYFPHNI